jgi:hypothetical protein
MIKLSMENVSQINSGAWFVNPDSGKESIILCSAGIYRMNEGKKPLSIWSRVDGSTMLIDHVSRSFPSPLKQIVPFVEKNIFAVVDVNDNLYLLDARTYIVIKTAHLKGCYHIGRVMKSSSDAAYLKVFLSDPSGTISSTVLQLTSMKAALQVNHKTLRSLIDCASPTQSSTACVVAVGLESNSGKSQLSLYSTKFANNLKLLVTMIENGEEEEAIEFVTSRKLPWDIYYKLKLEHISSADTFSVMDLVETLHKIEVCTHDTWMTNL